MAETTNVVFDDIVVSTYYDEAAVMPSEVGASVDGYKITLPARFETSPYEDLGVYEVYGSAEGMTVKAVVKAYGRYVNSNGFLLGYASRIWHEYVDGGEAAAEPVAVMVQTGTDYAPGDMVKYYPQLAGGVAADDTVYVTEPEHTVVISGKKVGGVSGYASASLSGDDPSSYTVNVSAVAANTDETASSARIIIVKYDKDGKVADFKTVNANLDAAMSGRREFSAEVGYSRSENEDIRIYLWDFGRLKPLGTTILVSQLEIPPKYSDEIMALIPDYDQVVENVQRANNYWQNTYSYNQSGGTKYPSFWDGSAYHTGNMEMYFTFNDEKDKEYSINWADYNEWMGNTNQGDKSKWTSGYTEDRSGTGALFGDWQICFQTYLDLNLLDPEERKAARAKEVMGYEITKSNDNFWWWADSLYMVTPVMTKMYLTTGDEDYLDAMYRYYLYAAELMYDGEDGIPNEGEEYKSTAKLNSGAAYSDPDNYANLFFRDANYVYPLKPNSGHENEKNFWARGNGWVFAGLAKVLNDLPTDYEHYGFFLKIYKEMAKAVIDCQQLDLEGRGFWTQSMLQDYPKGNNGNDEGYETSGTAFLTYGLFWGLNSGILDENTYLEPALRAWKYLSEEALHDDGRVGYVQYIGSNATDAISYNTTQNFGVGAFLLAGSEASRWVDGVTENNMPYLQRKLWHAVAFKDGKYFENGTVSEGTPAIERGGKTYVPIDEFTKRLGVDYEIGTSGAVIYDKLNSKRGSLNDEDVIEENGTVYASVTEMARAVGRYAVVYGNVTVVSHKNTVFYGCDEKSVEYLNSLLN